MFRYFEFIIYIYISMKTGVGVRDAIIISMTTTLYTRVVCNVFMIASYVCNFRNFLVVFLSLYYLWLCSSAATEMPRTI